VKNTRISKFKYAAALQALTIMGAGITAIVATPAIAQDVTSGSMSGVVVSEAGEPIQGASVTIVSEDRGFQRTATTSSTGSFEVRQLPAGKYSVTVEADGYATTKTEGVTALLGGANYSFRVGASTGDEIVVTGSIVRTVDFSGTASGVVFDIQDVASRIPVPRNIDSIQLLAPQTTSGDSAFGGVSIGGSSVAENIFYINGMNITNFRTFVGGTTVPFEFYDQVQVKTGGYQAEFGRNTGGAVIALTRSGSNEFHGGFNVEYTPNSTRSTARNTVTQANEFDKRSSIDGNIWASGPIIKDRLFFFGFFNPRNSSTSDTAITGETTKTRIDDPFFGGKIDLNLFDGHRVEATYFSDSQNQDVTLDGSPTTNFAGGTNMIFKYTGAFTDFLTLSALYGKSKFNQTSAGADDAIPYVLDGRVPANGLQYIAGNPAGVIDTGRDERENFRVDLDLNFNLLGEHNLRGGWDLEKLTAENFTIYSGGTYYRYYRSGAAGALGGLIAPNTDYVRVRNLQSGGKFDSENTAFYIQDSWDVSENLNLSLGLRNDRFKNNDGLGKAFTDLKNQWAPRVGFNFDPTGDKKMRISGFYGRYYLPVAANTNIRLAGSETFLQDWHELPVNGTGNYTGNLVPPTLGDRVLAEVLSPGGVSPVSTLVSKNLKPQYLDEFIIGGEYNFGNRLKASLNLTYRKLGAVLEDFDLDGSGSYDSIIEAYCNTQTLAYCSPTATPSVGSGGYVLFNPGKDVVVDVVDDAGGLHEVTLTNGFLKVPKAKRTYYAAEFKLDRLFDGVWGVSGSYVWSRSRGNYEGGVKSDNGQDDTGLTQDFDELGWNDGANGFLPNHREHTFKVYGSWAPVENLNLGFNALLQSPRKFGCQGTYPILDGRATNSLASSWYCNAQIAAGNIEGTLNQPVGRGSVFQSDWNKRIDLSIAYTIPVEGTGGFTFRADVFNALNLKSKLDFNEFGDLDDPLVINPNYRAVQNYQTPRFVRFSFSAKF
jgi:Carboxypeptidase regulatory-like domain/TonB dependent receptor/TonB-dependent Receptor Plug Domain